MSNEINLLKSKRRSVFSDLTTRLRILRFGALMLLSLVVLFSVGLFLLVIASPLPGLKEEENALVASLSSQHEKVVQQTIVTTRLQETRSIINKRAKMREIIALFRNELPEGVTIQVFTIDENVINLQASSSSLTQIETYLASLQSLVTDTKSLQMVQVNSLSLADTGYELVITATVL